MQVEHPGENEKAFWYPTPKNPGNESEHSNIQRSILKELRELADIGGLDPKKHRIANQILINVQTGQFTQQGRRSRQFSIHHR